MDEDKLLAVQSYKEAMDLCKKGNYEAALKAIEEIKLEVKYFDDLTQVKIRCYEGLGKKDNAKACYLENLYAKVQVYMHKTKFTDALKKIEDSPIDISVYPPLVTAFNTCNKVVSEVSEVNKCLVKANNLYKKKRYVEALEVIDNCGFDVEIHTKLLRTKVKCLKELGKLQEAFDGALFLLAHGLPMTPNLVEVLVEEYMRIGEQEKVTHLYSLLIEEEAVSDSDKALYRKYLKNIEIKRSHQTSSSEVNNEKTTKDKLVTLPPELVNLPPELVTLPPELETLKEHKGKEDIKSQEKLETYPRKFVKEVFTYEIEEKHLGGGLHRGETRYRALRYPKSFIESTISQIENFDDLRSLGVGNEYVVNVDSLVCSDDGFDLLVAEPLIPLDHFFQEESIRFQQSGDNARGKSNWWQKIAKDYTAIFSDVAHALIFLESVGRGCGNLKNAIFIDEQGRGKLLPSMDKKKKSSVDVYHLIEKMKAIITLPFDDDGIDESYQLPDELTRLLIFVTGDKLTHLPACWLYNHPFFWSVEERITFITDLKLFMKESIVHRIELESQLRIYGSYGSSYNWSVNIVDGIFKKIFDRPKTRPHMKEYVVDSPIEIVRYMGAGYNHVNDEKDKMKRFDIEAYFRSLFPDIYVNLYEAFYGYVVSFGIGSIEVVDVSEVFKKWASPYLAKQAPSISLRIKKLLKLSASKSIGESEVNEPGEYPQPGDDKGDELELEKVDCINYDESLKQLEEAKKYDHRLLGVKQELFFCHPLSPGSWFFLPLGTRIYNKLVDFIRKQYRDRGYEEVVSPNMYNMQLWETSGHAANYRENMFILEIEKQEFGLKPMNCPGHCLMFEHRVQSYRELPIRFADFGVLHRNEASGALTGLTRVRRFQQDDAHIFCMESQVKDEVRGALDFINYVYEIFGFTYELKLSTRPENYLGDLQTWDKAEAALTEALNEFGKPWQLNEGDGAFYGPKIDISVSDALKWKFQCATLQLDFQLPLRFNLSYSAEDEAKRERPVMLHRAILGSVERMFAILLEHYKGKWPFWLSPRQAIVCTVSERSAAYAAKVRDHIHSAGFYVDLDISDKTINKKVREAQLSLYNYILVVGEKDAENKVVTVRVRDKNEHSPMTVESLLQHFRDEVEAFH